MPCAAKITFNGKLAEITLCVICLFQFMYGLGVGKAGEETMYSVQVRDRNKKRNPASMWSVFIT